jgi:8-oxo-dGTP pyrophosphatase MutT (NUDIX family)
MSPASPTAPMPSFGLAPGIRRKGAAAVADSSARSQPVSEPTPAATVVPLRDGENGLEVLLLRRSSRGMFGGMWVFPGGQLDHGDADRQAGDRPGETLGAEVSAARRAAVREAQEEAGLELDVDRLVTLSFWLPPPQAARRFATWFFLAPAAEQPAVVVDDREIHEHRWYTPVAAMAARDDGHIQLAPPTFTTLWWLSQRPDVVSALADGSARPPERFMSRLAFDAEGRMRATLWEGDAGYGDADLDRPGPRRRLWVDPGGWRVEITR